jgi:predicted PurR-regulated permease PerM
MLSVRGFRRNLIQQITWREAKLRQADVLLQNRLLRQIVLLLCILALALFVAFFYFASSLCITLVLSSFLAILVDPLIMYLERFRIPRMISAAVIIAGATILVVTLTYGSYKQVADVIDDLPYYARKIGEDLAPITRKIETVRDWAGRLSAEVPTKKIPEVKVKGDYPEWTTYVIRGVGPVSGAAMIIVAVPFLMFFLLIQKDRLKEKLAIVWGDALDVSVLMTGVTQMVRGFVLGNLIIGALVALVTVGALFAMHVQGAPVLGVISGFLNLIPFIGAIAGAVVPMGAALIQGLPVATLVGILATVVGLHIVAVNLLVPKIIGTRVSVSPVAATVGILFWGWLWGLIGVLLAVPLTALVKIVADSHPSLGKIGNLLSEHPEGVPPWSRSATGTDVPQLSEASNVKVRQYMGNLRDNPR